MVSVCVATYNGEKFIKEQIKSILYQLDIDDEIIISDDGSTDNTLSIVDSFNDARIKVFCNSREKNKSKFIFYNTSLNFENAIYKSKGDLIFLSDQDDIWEDNKVKIVKEKICNKQLLVHDCMVVDKYNNIIYDSYFKLINAKFGFLNNIITSSYLGCCMAFKRDLLNSAIPFPIFPVPHDIWLGLIAETKRDVVVVEDKLVRYRRHQNNLSQSSENSINSFAFKVEYRILLLLSIFFRILKIN